MAFEDCGRLLAVGCERPIAVVKRAAQDNSIAARKHIAAAEITIVNLRLRQEHFQLAAHRLEFLIVKERARAQARAVEYHWLGQTLDLFAAAEFLYYQLATGDVKVAQQRVEID